MRGCHAIGWVSGFVDCDLHSGVATHIHSTLSIIKKKCLTTSTLYLALMIRVRRHVHSATLSFLLPNALRSRHININIALTPLSPV